MRIYLIFLTNMVAINDMLKGKVLLDQERKCLELLKERISEAEYKPRSAQNSIEQLNKVFEEVKKVI